MNYPNYPTIAEDYAKTFGILKRLPCDVFLSSHAHFFGLNEKFQRLEAGVKSNPFIDPVGCLEFIDQGERTYFERLEQDRHRSNP